MSTGQVSEVAGNQNKSNTIIFIYFSPIKHLTQFDKLNVKLGASQPVLMTDRHTDLLDDTTPGRPLHSRGRVFDSVQQCQDSRGVFVPG
jgi:hypothetical protein